MKTIKTVGDLKNTKIYIEDKEDVITFQEIVLGAGVKWVDYYNGTRPKYNMFYISKRLEMTVGPVTNKDGMLLFINNKNRQIFLEDIVRLKHGVKFRAKEEVLVRQSDSNEWWLTEFSHYTKECTYPHACTNGSAYQYCIPYEENKHLLGTTKNK